MTPGAAETMCTGIVMKIHAPDFPKYKVRTNLFRNGGRVLIQNIRNGFKRSFVEVTSGLVMKGLEFSLANEGI